MGFAVLALDGSLQCGSGPRPLPRGLSLDKWIKWAECIITGEGRLDRRLCEESW
ncbi:MAG TPA: hypothetical protein DD856_11155 [Sulfobacillus sp.]|nr:hypothetical protein [Sulfobacillus sp.]